MDEEPMEEGEPMKEEVPMAMGWDNKFRGLSFARRRPVLRCWGASLRRSNGRPWLREGSARRCRHLCWPRVNRRGPWPYRPLQVRTDGGIRC